jgi:hypothetical protein
MMNVYGDPLAGMYSGNSQLSRVPELVEDEEPIVCETRNEKPFSDLCDEMIKLYGDPLAGMSSSSSQLSHVDTALQEVEVPIVCEIKNKKPFSDLCDEMIKVYGDPLARMYSSSVNNQVARGNKRKLQDDEPAGEFVRVSIVKLY